MTVVPEPILFGRPEALDMKHDLTGFLYAENRCAARGKSVRDCEDPAGASRLVLVLRSAEIALVQVWWAGFLVSRKPSIVASTPIHSVP